MTKQQTIATSPLGVGWGVVALIGIFWTFYAGVMFATLMVSEILRTDVGAPGILLYSFMGAYVWAGLTLPAFRLTEAFGLVDDSGAWRASRVAGLFFFGLGLAAAISVAIAVASHAILEDSLGGVFAGPGGRWVMLRYRLANDVLACQFLFAAGVARDYFIRYRSRLAEAAELRSQLGDMRLQLLRTQLNPHFLFNTLNTIAALVQSNPKGVRRMIALLSELMRDALYGAPEAKVILEREVGTLRRYLEIMEIRFGGTLRTRIEIDSNVSTALVPQLILQPLVENALKHGVPPDASEARVDIIVSRIDGQLVACVRDIGVGLKGTAMPSSSGRHEHEQGGFGLKHTRERLRQLYGDAAQLELRPSVGGGTVAEIRLPYQAKLDTSGGLASSNADVP